MCLNKQINGSKVPRLGDVQALSASVQRETQPAERKATSTQGGRGEGEAEAIMLLLKQVLCTQSTKACQADTACTQPLQSWRGQATDFGDTTHPGAQDTHSEFLLRKAAEGPTPTAMGSTCIPLCFCSLSILISSFLPVLILQSAS